MQSILMLKLWCAAGLPVTVPLIILSSTAVLSESQNYQRDMGAENNLPSLKMMQNHVCSPECYEAVEEETFSL